MRADPIAKGARMTPATDAVMVTVKTRKNVPISSTTYFRLATAARLGTATAPIPGVAVTLLIQDPLSTRSMRNWKTVPLQQRVLSRVLLSGIAAFCQVVLVLTGVPGLPLSGSRIGRYPCRPSGRSGQSWVLSTD